MPTSRRRARAVGSRLFGVYALASLVPVLVLGVVLVDTERAAGVERGLAQGRAQADVVEQMAVSPAPGQPGKTLWRDRLVIGGRAAPVLWPMLWAAWQWRGARIRSLAPSWAHDPERTPDGESPA